MHNLQYNKAEQEFNSIFFKAVKVHLDYNPSWLMENLSCYAAETFISGNKINEVIAEYFATNKTTALTEEFDELLKG